MKSFKIHSHIIISDASPLVREHRVHDIHILPGVSMLDGIYKTLSAAKLPPESVLLRNILFHEPVVTNASTDRQLKVSIELYGKSGAVSVSSIALKEGKSLPEQSTLHLTCNILVEEAFGPEWKNPMVPENHQHELKSGVDLDECYAVTRQIGIVHDNFMKCLGSVADTPDGGCFATVKLGARAAARDGDFILHPVFLDCATIVPMYHLRQHIEEASLFIPFGIEEFRALPLTGRHQLYVRVDAMDSEIKNQEILRYSSTLLDMNGQALGHLHNFSVKRVRSLESIKRLLVSGTSSRASFAQAKPQVVKDIVEETAANRPQADSLIALLGALISKETNQPWRNEHAQQPFFDLGLDSLALVDMSEALEKQLGVRLYPTILFEYPSAEKLAGYLRDAFPDQVRAFCKEDLNADAVSPVPASIKPLISGQDAQTPQILSPHWVQVAEASDFSHKIAAAPTSLSVALLGKASTAKLQNTLAQSLGDRLCFRSSDRAESDLVDEFRSALQQGLLPDALWLVDIDHNTMFSLVKTLLELNKFQSLGEIKAITLDCFRVHREEPSADAPHGAWGLLQSLSREHPNIRVSQLDLFSAELGSIIDTSTTGYLLSALMMPASQSRELRAIRAGRVYERSLFAVQSSDSAINLLRHNGFYLIIGGAGGVGMAFVRHLRQHYDARVAIIGRRPLDDQLQTQLAAEGKFGEKLLYLQADVADADSLHTAIGQARKTLGALNGIIHSAMVLDDKRLIDMDATSFAQVLQPKVEGSRALGEATADLPLDFLLYFSSIQSYVGNVSQANYAAASTYLDGYAAVLRAQRQYPVIVVNWGFWSNVGVVANSAYRHLMERQGIFGLQSESAFAALEDVLSSGWSEALIVAAEEPILEEMGLRRDWLLKRSSPVSQSVESIPSIPDLQPSEELTDLFSMMQCNMDELMILTRRRIGSVLRELGIDKNDPISVETAVAGGRIAREHNALVKAFQLQIVGDSLQADDELDAKTFLAELTALENTRPLLQHFIPLLRASVSHYIEILSGRMPASEALFPKGSPELVRKIYGENEMSLFYNQRVAEVVRKIIEQRPASTTRILEVGAGTGSTAEEILRVLNEAGHSCDYHYTDLWDKLVTEARQRMGARYPNMRFNFLDINTDPASQGMNGQYDIIVATNVLHATRDLHLSLRHIKRLLRPGGALVMNESVQIQSFSTCTFGLLPGWWNAIDSRDRLPGSPLCDAATWIRLMRDEGFIDIHTLLPGTVSENAAGAQQIFTAYSDGLVFLPGQIKENLSGLTGNLPKALAGKLRPYEDGISMPPLRHIHLFQDLADNLWLFLDNPPANLFNDALLEELCATLKHLSEQAPHQLRGQIVYLSHFGDYFSLGGDRSEILRLLASGRKEALNKFAVKATELLQLIAGLDSIVVSVVNGTAQGGGMETLFSTDIQLVREGVKLGLPEIRSGLIPGMGGLTYLQGQIGAARTKRLVMLGELIDAQEALSLGVISHVVVDPFAAALELPQQIGNIDTALHMKKILNRETNNLHAFDIPAWLHYLDSNLDNIDATRIENTDSLLKAKMRRKSPLTDQ